LSFKLSVIGGGVMAEAIISRLLKEKKIEAQNLLISEPQATRRDFLQREYNVLITSNNSETFKNADVLLLAIKPQVLDVVVAELNIQNNQNTKPLLISILAGVTLERLEKEFPSLPIIRTMPNTPATVGVGMTAISPNNKVSSSDLSLTKSIFTAMGEVIEVPESLMNGVTGVSGSGPAFVAMMIEALADGGVVSGLPRAIANQLALQTVLGTAQLLKESNLHPAILKDRVTSPGGTTIAGVAKLEENGFRSAIIEAVKAAYFRSQEL
jgi:pyrroline-5-carboxylate reductase